MSISTPDAQVRGRRVREFVCAFRPLRDVDGRPVAMGKDSRLPTEVDLTGVVTPGVPFELALSVVRWSDATWIEDQDHWFHAGLHRSVCLYSTEATHLADVAVTAGLAADGTTGTLVVDARLGGPPVPDGWTVEARVETATDQPVMEPLTADLTAFRSDTYTDRVIGAHVWPGPVAHLEATLVDVRPWSTEVPQRYRLVVSLRDDSGAIREATAQWIGFRSVEIRARAFWSATAARTRSGVPVRAWAAAITSW